MDVVSLGDIIVTPLNRIQTLGGDVMHALKSSDNGFKGFGEVYFSWIENGAIKAWKCHQRMTLNLVVPVGKVRIVFYLMEQNKNFRMETIGENNYVRLTIPPRIWFGFQGISSGNSLLMNVADMEHDPGEVSHKPTTEFIYDWSSK